MDNVDRNIILQMTTYEDTLRKSDEIQKLYDVSKVVVGEHVEFYIQKSVLRKFGFDPSNDNLTRYHGIYTKYANDQEIVNSVVYMKYRHLFQECRLRIGEQVPNSVLMKMDKTRCSVYDFVKEKNLLVVAGSIT